MLLPFGSTLHHQTNFPFVLANNNSEVAWSKICYFFLLVVVVIVIVLQFSGSLDGTLFVQISKTEMRIILFFSERNVIVGRTSTE